jgi:hypothetical protein
MNTELERLNDMISHQIKNIDPTRKLLVKDIRRIIKNVNNVNNRSIFTTGEDCTFWNGICTKKIDDTKRGQYISFFYNKKKTPLHRLLYENFVSKLEQNQLIKFKCGNQESCCNINHMEIIEINKKKKVKNNIIIPSIISQDFFTLHFD